MITIACVLRSGGIYTPAWVWALQAGLRKYAPVHHFVCLSNVCDQLNGWGVPLEHNWPGWWSKVELFRPELFSGRVLYIDLDTLPVGSLDEIASYAGEFAMLSDFYRPRFAQSGVMLFTPGKVTEHIWRTFSSAPEELMRRFRGDGEFLCAHTNPDRLQDLFPGQIVSLKQHAKNGCPANARLVCAHGQPKFDSAKAGWAHARWAAA